MEIKAVLPNTTNLETVLTAHGRENHKRLFGDIPTSIDGSKAYVFSTNVADRIWETFLEALPDEYRDTWRCGCCKEFVRKYGTYVVLYKDPETRAVSQAPLFFFQSEALSGAPELQPAFAACEALLNEAKPVQFQGYYIYIDSDDRQIVLGNVAKGQRADGARYEHFFIPCFVRDYAVYHNDWKKHKARAYDLFHGPALDAKLKATETLVEHLAVKHNKRSSNLTEYLERLKKFHVERSDNPDFVKEYEFQYRVLSDSQWLIHYNSSAVAAVIDSLMADQDLEAAVRRLGQYTHFTTYRRPQEASAAQLEAARKELQDKGLMQYLQLRHTRTEELDWQSFTNHTITTAPDEAPTDVMSGLFDKVINAVKPKELTTGKRQLASGKRTMSFQKFVESLQSGEIVELFEVASGTGFTVLRSQVDPGRLLGKSDSPLTLAVHWVQGQDNSFYPAFNYRDYGIASVVEDWNRGVGLLAPKNWLVSEDKERGLSTVILRYEANVAPKVPSPFLVPGDCLNGEFYPYRAAIQEVTKQLPDDGLMPVVVTAHYGRMGSIDDLPQPHTEDSNLCAMFKGSDVVWRLSIIG